MFLLGAFFRAPTETGLRCTVMIRDRENFLRVDTLIVITGRHNILAMYYDLPFSRNIINKTFFPPHLGAVFSSRSGVAFLSIPSFSIFLRSITVRLPPRKPIINYTRRRERAPSKRALCAPRCAHARMHVRTYAQEYVGVRHAGNAVDSLRSFAERIADAGNKVLTCSCVIHVPSFESFFRRRACRAIRRSRRDKLAERRDSRLSHLFRDVRDASTSDAILTRRTETTATFR